MSPEELKDYIDQQIQLHEHNGLQATRINASDLFGSTSSSSTTYAGYVAAAGTAVNLPSGWTSTKTGTGAYTVTHNLGTTGYALVATSAGGAFGVCAVYAINANDFHLSIVSTAASFQDTDFTFVLVTT